MRPSPLPWLLLCVPACSSASASAQSAPEPVSPDPVLMQYVGEYDAPSGAGLTRLTLHVNGTFDATSDGRAVSGTFVASGSDATTGTTASLDGVDTSGSRVTFRTVTASGGPVRIEITVVGALGDATLTAPWLAGDENMCDATGGRWTDDDPDPSTGLFCVCSKGDLYLPSRGGCVSPAPGGDPSRLALTDEARAASGHFAGKGRVTELDLDDDGTYQATIDDRPDEGTWWPAGPPGALAVTSAAEAFWATFDEGALTVDLGDGPETLDRTR